MSGRNSGLTRRQIMRRGLGGAAGLVAASYAGPVLGAKGANDRIRVAVAGLNGRGGSHIEAYTKMNDVEIAYLVDPDSRLFDSRVKTVQEKAGDRPKCVQDIREALNDKTIDAVSIATPNHWHSLMTVWACQAGKDVYVEKPLSHNIHEGRVAVELARKFNRIVQHGTQRRSERGWATAIAAIHSGKLGKLKVARGFCYKKRGSIGFKQPTTPPKELDFNLWLGPAEQQPYHENLVHYNWHWFWSTGNGDIGNQGVHQMDVARWGIKGGTLPRSVISVGGRFGYTDQGQTANTQVTLFDFGDTQMIFEVRGLPSEPYRGVGVGNVFDLEEGSVIEGKFRPKGSDKAGSWPSGIEPRLGPGDGNFRNFIEAVKSRKAADLNADILEGHYSSALCHLANMSYRLGEEMPLDSAARPFGRNDDANEAFDRMKQHLSVAKVEPAGTKFWIGRKLIVDPKTEMIVGNPQANAMWTRLYREGFVLPDAV